MKIVSKRTFEATAMQLWLIVRDPGNMPAWNPKCVECTSLPDARAGDRFAATFHWKDRAHQSEGEVLECVENERITYRLFYEEGAMPGSVDESFRLKALGPNSTRLYHEVDFRNTTLPRWVKIVIGILGRFGRKTGSDSLDNIEDLLKPQ